MRNKLITYLKKAHPEPLSSKESQRMWQHVASDLGFAVTSTRNTSTLLYFTMWYKPAFAFVMGLMLIFTSSYTVQAADASGPGDLLYPLDLTLENIEVGFTPQSKREPLYYRYAMERINELAIYTDSNPNQEDFNKQQQYVAAYLENVSDKLNPNDRERVRQHYGRITVTTNSETSSDEQIETEVIEEEIYDNTGETNYQTHSQTDVKSFTPTANKTVETKTNYQTNPIGESKPTETKVQSKGETTATYDTQPEQTKQQTQTGSIESGEDTNNDSGTSASGNGSESASGQTDSSRDSGGSSSDGRGNGSGSNSNNKR